MEAEACSEGVSESSEIELLMRVTECGFTINNDGGSKETVGFIQNALSRQLIPLRESAAVGSSASGEGGLSKTDFD